MRFIPSWTVVGKMKARAEHEVRAEPMLFAADRVFAWDHGGPLTREFIGSMLGPDVPWVIDSKVVMLMPGFWPCIPGWHHDDVPRTRSDGQPNYDSPEYSARHAMAIVGDCSLTEFVAEPVDLPPVPVGRTVYQAWDRMLEAMRPATKFLADRDIVCFDAGDFHRGSPATKPGWRWFIRATTDTKRPVMNEVRTQVQVYLSDPSVGW